MTVATMTLEEQHVAHKERLARMKARPIGKPVHGARQIAPPPPRDIIHLFTGPHHGRTIYEYPIIIRQPDPEAITTCKDIIRAVSAHSRIPVRDLISARRTANVVRPRQVAMYLARVLTLRSLPDIGRRFGNRDHTTILHAVRKIQAQVDAGDPELIRVISDIKFRLGFPAEAAE